MATVTAGRLSTPLSMPARERNAMAVFIVYTSYQQSLAEEARIEAVARSQRAEAQRNQLQQDLNQQSELLVCFATDTNLYSLGVTEALLADPRAAQDPRYEQAVRNLEAAKLRLQAARVFSNADPPRCRY